MRNFPNRKGENNSNAKLTKKDLKLLKADLKKIPVLTRFTASFLGLIFGISGRQVYRIRANQALVAK
jgi:hypothetical protein